MGWCWYVFGVFVEWLPLVEWQVFVRASAAMRPRVNFHFTLLLLFLTTRKGWLTTVNRTVALG